MPNGSSRRPRPMPGQRRVQPPDQAEPGCTVPDRARYAQMRAAELMVHEAADLYEAGRDLRAEANMAALGRRRLLGGGRHVRADPWQVRLCRGIRHRAQVPRDPPLPDRADLDQPDPVVSRRARARPAALVLRKTNRRNRVRPRGGAVPVSPTLLADIGGSKNRFASPIRRASPSVLVIENDTGDLEAAVYTSMRPARPRRGVRCRGAGRRRGDRAHQSAMAFPAQRLRRFGFRVFLVNDFEAVAWALPRLEARPTPGHRPSNGAAQRRQGRARARHRVGRRRAGTGRRPLAVVASEGGRASFGPQAADEAEVFARLREQSRRAVGETVLSGPGLLRLARALDPRAQYRSRRPSWRAPWRASHPRWRRATVRAAVGTLLRRRGAHLQGAGRGLHRRRVSPGAGAVARRAAVPQCLRGAPPYEALLRDPDPADHLQGARADRLCGAVRRAHPRPRLRGAQSQLGERLAVALGRIRRSGRTPPA